MAREITAKDRSGVRMPLENREVWRAVDNAVDNHNGTCTVSVDGQERVVHGSRANAPNLFYAVKEALSIPQTGI